MKWLEISIELQGEDPDLLCMLLEECGVGGMIVEDESDFRSFLENNKQYWDYVDDELERRFEGASCVKFYLSDNDEGQKTLETVRNCVSLPLHFGYIEDADWENNWRQYYAPIKIGKRLLIVPEWQSPELGDRIALRLDPGLIFGTGSHATTRMCLERLEKYSAENSRVLDLGCGSGILGIGAILLGCKNVRGCDIDPKAPKIAAENAMLNDICSDRFDVLCGDVISNEALRHELGGGYDLVLANIVADVIIALMPHVRQMLAPGGKFICSGIIEGRQSEVKAQLAAAGLKPIECQNSEDWHCLVCEISQQLSL